MENDQKEFERIIKKTEELTKVMHNVEQILDGMEYRDKISLLSTMLMKIIVQSHETAIEVVADIGNIFATMIASYRMMNDIEDDDDEYDDEEDSVRQ